ncbi:MAG: pantetheine-phosphate adenylyltransferase [Legionella sp.]
MMTRPKAIYPGTFDPVTNGHIDIIIRAAKIFPQLIVAVADNVAKRTSFTLNQRIDLIKDSLGNMPGVSVVGFDSLLISFAKQQDASVIIRGLRAVSDFEYEFQLAGMNRNLNQDIETLFLTPSEHYTYISSTLVREIAAFGGDVSEFVPSVVAQALATRLLNR